MSMDNFFSSAIETECLPNDNVGLTKLRCTLISTHCLVLWPSDYRAPMLTFKNFRAQYIVAFKYY